MAINAGRTMLDAEGYGFSVDGVGIFLRHPGMALPASGDKVDPIDSGGWLRGTQETMDPVALGADRRVATFGIGLAVHGAEVRGEADGQADIILSDHRAVAMASGAGLRDIIPEDEALGVVRGQYMMTVVAVGTGSGCSVAMETSQAVG